jgi:hypothetical protein
MLFFTGHRPKELGAAQWTHLSHPADGSSLLQAALTLDQWPDTFIYKLAVDKTHQHSNKPDWH